MDAATHARTPLTVETFMPAGPLTEERQLHCLNPECWSPDHLVLIETADVITPVTMFSMGPGITDPEIERRDDRAAVMTQVQHRRIVGYQCTKCRSGLRSDTALRHLLANQ